MQTLARPADPTTSERKEEVSEQPRKTPSLRSGIRVGVTHRPGSVKPEDVGVGNGPHQPYP